MGIVLNETRWTEEMIANHTLGKKPSETLRRVARYYYDLGNGKRRVRKLLENFLITCDPCVSLPLWARSIETALTNAKKREAIDIEQIIITEPEMKTIDSIHSVMARRLAFTLLCLAKYWDIANDNQTHWVNSKDSDIMRMANINTSIRRQGAIYHDLGDAGLLRFSHKVDNTNIQVNYIQDGPTVLVVDELRNLGFQYAMYHNPTEYVKCANCGLVVKRDKTTTGRPQQYCKECAASIRLKQNVESVMRKRYGKVPNSEIVGKN